MATIIYDDELGARTTKVFGCSFKSITAQMGFNSQPIVFTVTVVEENDQDFTLNQNDIRSVQRVTFGELSILGIVQSWEKTTVDSNGTGIYVVRLTDCRSVLDTARIANVYSVADDININLIYVGSTEEDIAPFVSNKDGTPFGTIMGRVEAATLKYGNNTFEVDMSALLDLTNSRGEGIYRYYIEGEMRSLVSVITEFCNAVGAEWWVESRRKSIVDDTIVIEIKVIRRLDGIMNPYVLEMDELVALHDNRVIRRKDGYENQDTVTNKVIWGGVKRKLQPIHGNGINQFWGFDEFEQPLLSPSYVMPNDPQHRRIATTVQEMENVLNGDLDNSMDLEQLTVLKQYIDDVWGRRFYLVLNKYMMSDPEQELPDYPKITLAGWWEGTLYPQGGTQFDPDILMKMTTGHGRWGPFVHLSELFLTGSGTAESPTQARYITWAPTTQNSSNLIRRDGESYMKCTLKQYGRYVVITLPASLTRYYIDPETGEPNESRTTRHNSLSEAWIPIMDRGIRYGPWSNVPLLRQHIPLPGNSEVSVDNDLVPWTFGIRGMLHETAMEQLIERAAQKIDTLPGLPIINTGQLEVAGVPQVNIGQALGLGGSITEIFIRFDNHGVTTRYSMNLYTRELGRFPTKDYLPERTKTKVTVIEEEIIEEDEEDEEDMIGLQPEPEPLPEEEEEFVLSKDATEYILGHPEGGMGVITGKWGGPFYSITRTSYLDLSSWFAEISAVFSAPEWSDVRNLAEPLNSPGLLPIGTHVTVSIFSEDESGPFVPYIEQTPQVFSPPPLPG